MVNFETCAKLYVGNQSLIDKWGWTGGVRGIQKNTQSQITYEGCVALCGKGSDWYPWSQSSQTITTWLLPIIGILLQAPFESSAFWSTMLAIARWVGSPMSSLSYILWNISVTGKCALMVDMAVPYDYRSSSKHTDFSNIRDSFYILTTLNQYSVKPMISLKEEAEGLLRIVLFSKDLRLSSTESLREMRQELASSLRKRRRRGVVPVFISTMWFLFSLAISIQAAFGQLGQNATAHDLALGLLLGWLPILIMCTIVDRNTLAADDVREQINHLIDVVCQSLQDETIVEEFIETFRKMPEYSDMKMRVLKIADHAQYLQHNFLTRFAGQGRVRWHYGAAHPILSDIENCYIAEHGRDWLHNEEEARTKLVLGSADRGLFWFDWRQLWQINSAIIIVIGTSMGALTISYFTPTVGLGCRSLGYLIFMIMSLSLLILEFMVWWLTSEEREEERLRRGTNRRSTRLQSAKFVQLEETSAGMLKRAVSWALVRREKVEEWLLKVLPPVLSWPHFRKAKRAKKREKHREKLAAKFRESHEYTKRQWMHRLFFVPMEIVNASWLCYIVLAQTFGSYVTCKCKSSDYGFGGGYIDFLQTNVTHNKFVKWYWSAGTSVSCAILGLGLVYVVTEWCLQSHISTESYDDARKGLQRTRKFRHAIFFIRYPSTQFVLLINSLRDIIFRAPSRQETLVWAKDPPKSKESSLPAQEGTEMPHYSSRSVTSPTFQFDHYSGGSEGDATSGAYIPLVAKPGKSYRPSHKSGRSLSVGSSAGAESVSQGEIIPIPGREDDRLLLSPTLSERSRRS